MRHRRHAGRERAGRVGIGQMNDQRMVGRPALGGEDLRHRRIVIGACTEAVDRFGRKGDELAGGQRRGRALDVGDG